MRLFPVDWPGFLDELAEWGELSIAARRAFVDGTAPGLSIDPADGGAPAVELRDAGFLEETERGGALGVGEGRSQFHQVLKSLSRYALFESPGLAVLCSYLAEHYSPQERSQLHESLALLPNDLPRIAGFVSSVEWLQAALSRAPRSAETAGYETARAMLAFFTEQRDRIPLRDLEEYFPGIARDILCAGIRYGVQRALFFLGLRRTDLEPIVGIWPAAARRLRRLSVVLAPEPAAVVQVFRHPFLVEDMTTLLAAAGREPIPLRRGDDRPFIRFVEEAGAALLTLPEWMESFTGLSLDARIGLALQALRLVGLLEAAGADPGSPAALAPGPSAPEWLRKPFAERQELVRQAIAGRKSGGTRLFDLLEEEWASAESVQEEILPWLVQAFSFVPGATFIRFADFAEYQAAIGSPLAAASLAGSHGDEPGAGAPVLPTEEAIEELWKSFLGLFLGRCLLSLGGAEAGLTEDGRPCFRMTDAGRFLLGIPRDGLSGPGDEEAPTEAPLIVQPNYEIVFLSPDPGIEAELGRFCERIGRGVGVLFRITAQSVRRAFAAGRDADQLLDALARNSKSPLPSNVIHEIRGWMTEKDG